MPIYNKPTRVLMHDFAKSMLAPGQVFDKKQAVDWFATHYPNIKSNTVALHVDGMAVNSGLRKHHANIRPGSGHDLFYKIGPGKFRLWNKEVDPAPIYPGAGVQSADDFALETTESEEIEGDSGSDEFAFERDLRNYLGKNLGLIEAGLKVYEEEGFNGIEFPVGGRFIDILAIDAKGGYLVIELKVSRGYDRTVGQLLRYMGWVTKNLAAGKRVRGVKVASEITEDLILAASLISDVQLIEYELSLKLHSLNN